MKPKRTVQNWLQFLQCLAKVLMGKETIPEGERPDLPIRNKPADAVVGKDLTCR
jgi:hypothetical protein